MLLVCEEAGINQNTFKFLMKLSRFNIISAIKDSDKYFVVNLLSQNADILSKEEWKLLNSEDGLMRQEFIEAGYVVDLVEEEKMYKKKYLDFIDTRSTDEVQIFYVPGYVCNFSCSYCYQDEYINTQSNFSEEVLGAFFGYVKAQFLGRKKYITIFGGEPLLPSGQHKKQIASLLNRAKDAGLDVAIVTNGFHLTEYIPILKEAHIREIQVTLDGTESVHDSRRKHKSGQSTFAKIVEGIDGCIREKIPVNLRMVLDKENISNLPEFARFAIEKEWTKSAYFKTQLGRNYELHHCQSQASRLFSRLEMYESIYQMLKEYPFVAEFHKPAFSVAKFLFQEGILPDPLFDSCPGTKTEWAFDYRGKIYSCTATVGKPGEELGSFYPEVKLNEDAVAEWSDRDVLSIEKCRSCELQLACGGGCASVAKNNHGSVNTPDCRPVRELLELGIAHYFTK